MPDSFVLNWEIDVATLEAAGKAESQIFMKRGFKWTATVEKEFLSPSEPLATFSVRCEVDHNSYWDCDCDVRVRLRLMERGIRRYDEFAKGGLHFNEECGIACVDKAGDGVKWSDLISGEHNFDGKVFAKIDIGIDVAVRGRPIDDPGKFSAPNHMSNVILKIGDKKLHVSKEYLAVHSPVFTAMFFGEFAEKGKEEVEIKDVVYEEFVYLLHVIFPGLEKIMHRNVSGILKLADRFQIEHLIKDCEQYLIKSDRFVIAEKLFFADQYRLSVLKNKYLAILKDFHKYSERQELKSSPEFANFSDEMKAEIIAMN